MFLIFFLIFWVTCGCWGVAGLQDENRLYAHVLVHHARSRSLSAQSHTHTGKGGATSQHHHRGGKGKPCAPRSDAGLADCERVATALITSLQNFARLAFKPLKSASLGVAEFAARVWLRWDVASFVLACGAVASSATNIEP